MALPRPPASGGADEKGAPQSAKAVRGASPYIEIKDEPPPKLIVDEPLSDGLPQGIVWIQYRTENCRILPVFGKAQLVYGRSTSQWATVNAGMRTSTPSQKGSFENAM